MLLLLITYCWLGVHMRTDAVNVTNCFSPPPSQEVDALLALYSSTSGAGWVPAWPVSNSTNCCDGTWSGVSCVLDSRGVCHVDSLELAGYMLTGTLPMALGNLSYLTAFEVSQNYLVGTLPPTICQWSQLSILVLNENQMTGSLPWCLAALQQLSYLDVNGNDFTGSLPAFSALSKLEIVYASSNELTGTIPASMWSIPTLFDLEISSNFFSGSLPSEMPCWEKLQVLDLSENRLTGSMPATMNTASAIVYLDISNNRITGSLPTFDNVTTLCFSYLNSNAFEGSVPLTWGNLVSMSQLDFSLQLVSGTLPSTLGNLHSLSTLWGNSNFISGTIPAALSGCTSLTELLLYQNMMSGPIPDALVNLRQLSLLLLFLNTLSGALPAAIGNMTALNDVELYTNEFTGTIPTSLGSIPTLQTLLLDDNFFSFDLAAMFSSTAGHQPSSFLALKTFSISYNRIHSNWNQAILPASLMYLDLQSCSLTGTLPEQWLNETSLVLLDVSINTLVGTLPPRLLQTTVEQIFIDYNAFHGSFPAMDASVTACTMQNVHLANNYLSGSLSPSLSQCHQLSTFVASEMHLSGPIDEVFANPRQLRELVVNNNFLTGRVASVFANSTATGLILNAAYNQFTGPLPMQSLATGQYQALILTENCMTGSLPSDLLCANRNLTELLLSGLHAASTCRSTVVGLGDGAATIGGWSVYSSYVESEAVYGSLPSCVLYLPQLSFLALSGNRLTGTIASGAGDALSANLEGIDLSHNQLSGTIPTLLLTTPSRFVDLSFNRFSGTLPSDAVYPFERVDPSWSLQVNMLSGTLPAAWETFPQINVLEGNLFACETDTVATTAHLPTHDPFATTYTCGSSATDLSLLVAVVGGVLFLGLVAAWEWWSPARTTDERSGGGGERDDDAVVDVGGRGSSWGRRLHRAYVWGRSEAQFVWHVVRDYRGLLVGVVAMLVASMLVYVGTSLASSAYAYLYIWVIALALQQGAAAAMVLLAWLTGFVLWLRRECNGLIAQRQRMKREKAAQQEAAERIGCGDGAGDNDTSTASTDAMPSTPPASWWRSWLYPALVVSAVTLTLTVPSFVVNIVYVYTTTLNHVSRERRLGIVWAMACFKLGWNLAMTWAVMRWDYFGLAQANASRKRWLSLFATIGVVNVILSPLLTEVLVSPNCFQYVFTRIPIDSYFVQGGLCYWITYLYVDPVTLQATPMSAFPCMSYIDLEATYDSGSVGGGNTDMSVLSVFNDGLQSQIDFQAGFAYNNQCAFSILQAFVHVFVYRYVLSIVVLPVCILCVKRWQRRRVQTLVTSSAASSVSASSMASTLRWLRWSMRCVPMQFRVVDWDVAAVATGAVDEVRMRAVLQLNEDVLREWTRDGGRRIGMCVDLLWLRMVSDLGILLSFGVLFPPLGLLVLVGGGLELWWMQAFIVRLRGHVRAVQAVGEWRTAVQTVSNPLAPTTGMTTAATMEGDDSGSADEEAKAWLRRYQTQVLTTMGRLEAALVDTMPRVVGEVFVVLCFAALLWGLAVFDVLGRSSHADDRSAVWMFAVVVTMPQWTTLLARAAQMLWEARWRLGITGTATAPPTATATATGTSSKQEAVAEDSEASAKDIEMKAIDSFA